MKEKVEKDIVGLCPYCNKNLTMKDIREGVEEDCGLMLSLEIFTCKHCKRIISITYRI